MAGAPRQHTSLGRMASIWRKRNGEHASTSSFSGGRVPGRFGFWGGVPGPFLGGPARNRPTARPPARGGRGTGGGRGGARRGALPPAAPSTAPAESGRLSRGERVRVLGTAPARRR